MSALPWLVQCMILAQTPRLRAHGFQWRYCQARSHARAISPRSLAWGINSLHASVCECIHNTISNHLTFDIHRSVWKSRCVRTCIITHLHGAIYIRQNDLAHMQQARRAPVRMHVHISGSMIINVDFFLWPFWRIYTKQQATYSVQKRDNGPRRPFIHSHWMLITTQHANKNWRKLHVCVSVGEWVCVCTRLTYIP